MKKLFLFLSFLCVNCSIKTKFYVNEKHNNLEVVLEEENITLEYSGFMHIVDETFEAYIKIRRNHANTDIEISAINIIHQFEKEVLDVTEYFSCGESAPILLNNERYSNAITYCFILERKKNYFAINDVINVTVSIDCTLSKKTQKLEISFDTYCKKEIDTTGLNPILNEL